MKNEKFFPDIQTKCGNIANEILNAVIDTEQTFKCKWPNVNNSDCYTVLFDESLNGISQTSHGYFT